MVANDQTRLQQPLSAVLDMPAPAVEVGGAQLDSRAVQPGDLFLALSGEQHDGRDYIAAAVAAGACAIVADSGVSASQRQAADAVPLVEIENLSIHVSAIAGRCYGEPARELFLAGITGTNGKTTCSRLAAQLIRGYYGQCGVIGTLGAVLDDSVDEALNTTPDAVTVQRQLAQWRDLGVGHAALEVSSHSLVQGRVAALNFDCAVFTNLSHDHLDYHDGMSAYAEAKSRLFAFPGLRQAIVNLDDPYAPEMLAVLNPAAEVIGYSLSDVAAALSCSDIRHAADGVRANISSPWGSGELHCPLPGDFNLSNLLAALAVACCAGVPFEQVLERTPTLSGVPGRMEYVGNELDVQLVVDYAHTPDALLKVLNALRPHTRGQLICVFGCGGDRDQEKRPLMGRVATEHADRVVVTSDNPRTENPHHIVAEVMSGCELDVDVEVDRAAAIARAVKMARPGDCVLVAGKGHETYQQLGQDRLPFSDVQQLRLAAAEAVQL